MPDPDTRRQFFQHAGRVAAGLVVGAASVTVPVQTASGVDPIARKAARRFKLSCAAYSLRRYLDLRDPTMTLEEFIGKCAEWGTDGVELTQYYFKKPVTPEYVQRLKYQAIIQGQDITGSPVGNRFTLPPGPERERQITNLKSWIDICGDLGAPTIRIFAGNTPEGVEAARARKWAVECIEACCDRAAKRGVFLALENHGGVVADADGVLDIVRAVKCEWVGVNLDTGNFHTRDPYDDMARVAPYAITCQLKTDVRPAGGRKEAVDIPRVVDILRKGNYRGYVTLEYEGSEDPMTAVPEWLERIRGHLG